jgi:hypothetical protein
LPEKKEKDEDFLNLARERFKFASDAESDVREKSLDDHKFRIGDQWPDEILAARKVQKLPCLTVNRIPRTIAQVTNEQRQQRPAGQVNPVGDGADKETADVIQGIIRHIEVQSDADIAKDMAFDDMVTGGIGWLRVRTKYVSNSSDDQEIYIEPIENWGSVYSDPYESVTRPADFRFISCNMGPEEYKRAHPKSELAGIDSQMWTSMGDQAPGWIKSDGVRVAEYYYVEETEGKNKPIRKVMWRKINGIETLEGPTEVVGDEDGIIPVFPVKGEEKIVDGKRHLAGLVRYAKDPARMYNVWISSATTMIGMAPKPKYIAAAGQIDEYKAIWEKANDPSTVVLPYNPIDINGTAVAPPSLQSFEPPIQAMALMTKQADNDFKATTGIYDASLGEKGPDESGKAILARQKQTDIAILNFSDNLSRTLLHLYRYILAIIPKVYSERTVMRIIKPDGTAEMVSVNDAKMQDGVKRVFDITSGKYDVVVSVGPSYQTKRQESVATQLELAKSFPIVAQAAPDLMIRNLDIPQADEIADRVKLMLPPAILQAEDQNAVPQLHAKLSQATQQVEMLSKVNSELLEQVKSKQAEAQAHMQIEQLKNQTTMSKAELDAYVKITVAEIMSKAQNAQVRAQLESEEMQDIGARAHDVATQASDQMHERMMGQQQAQQQAQLSDQGHQQNLEQGEQSGQQQQDLQEQAQAASAQNGAGQ